MHDEADTTASGETVREINLLAISLALLRKKKALRASGRAISTRALDLWSRTKLIDDFDGIVVAAARRTSHFVPKDSPDFLRSLGAALRDDLVREARARGRPKRATGLLASSSRQRAKRGRPGAMTRRQEREWAKRVLQIQVELFRTAHGFRDHLSALKHLFKNPAELWEISAPKAIFAVVDPPVAGRQLSAISTRYRRAIRKFKLWPPVPKK